MDAPAHELACTLESSELVDRMQAWRHVMTRATSRRIEDRRLVATYPNDAQLLEQLRQLIDAEAACCSFLEFSLEDRSDSIVTELRLPADLPAPMRTVIRELIGDDQ